MFSIKTLFSVAFSMAITSVIAQQVSLTEAQRRATQFMQHHEQRRSSTQTGTGSTTPVSLSLAYTSLRDSDQRPLYYAFNLSEEQGFILVGGDESAEQILGYSESGSFDYDILPDNFRWWLSQYDKQISDRIDMEPAIQSQLQAAPLRTLGVGRHDIAPLVEAKWNQSSPYNNAVNAALHTDPNTSGYSFVTGCVATAMAQVMKHHNWPVQGKGSHTAPTVNYNSGAFSFTPSATFEGTRYDWDNMRTLADKTKDSYAGDSYTDVEANAVATLMYHAGVSVDMKYGNSSSAASFRIAKALPEYFGYDKSASYEEREFYTDDEWEEMIYNELDCGRPVLYGGQSNNGGHEFICDGYRTSDGLYSFNWGWGSYCDGWYALTGQNALKPNGSGIGGAGSDAAYTGGQDIIINVMPDAGGKERPLLKERNEGSIYLTVDNVRQNIYNYSKTSAQAPASVTASSFYNFSSTLTQFTLGVRALDKNTGMVYYWTCQNTTIALPRFSGNTYSFTPQSETLNIDFNDLTYNGTYELRPVVRQQSSTSDNDWVLMKAFNTDVFPKVIVTGAQAVEAQAINFTLSADEVEVGRQISLKHDAAYKGEISYSGYDPTILSVNANGVVTGLKEGSTTITVTGESYSINGNELFKRTTKDFYVTVVPTVKSDPVVSIESTILTTGATTTISVEGYDGEASDISYSSSNTDVATVADGLVSGVGEGSATISVNVPETDTSKSKTKEFVITVSGYKILIVDEPYMTNKTEDLLTVYVPVKNVSTALAVEALYAQYEVPGYYPIKTGYSSMRYPAGYCKDLTFTINNSQVVEKLTDGYKVSMKFYRDNDCTIPANIEEYSFTYHTTMPSYTLSSAGWGTITMPIDSELPNGVDWKFYNCLSIENDVLVLSEATTLKRNTPYIVSGTPGTANFTDNKWVDSRKLFTNGLLWGVLSDEAYKFQPSDYIMQNQGGNVAFYQVTTTSPKLGVAASPLRAFLRMPGNAPTNLAAFFPQPEDIAQIEAETQTLPASIYGLDGTPREKLHDGMNIVVSQDGTVKKIFVK